MQVLGEPFDPRLHEPIQEVHTAEYPEGAVMQQLRPGYMLGEKVLRPTLVNVATAPLDGPGYQPPAPAAAAENKVQVTEDDVVAASNIPAPEATTSELPAASKESAGESQPASQPEEEAKSKDHSSTTDTGDALTAVGSATGGEQYATQDIPLKDFKASLEAEAAIAGGDKAEEIKSEKAVEEAVASSEEA
jgi:hypothetical protein